MKMKVKKTLTKRPKKKIKNKKNIKNRGQPFTLYCRRERKEKEKK